MKKIRIWSDKRKGNTRWWVTHGKEVLSGPWKCSESAVEAKKEWVL